MIGIDSVAAGNYQLTAFVLFVIGRALGTYLLRFISAGKQLFYYSLLGIIFLFGVVFIQGIYGLYCLVAVSFCLSVKFPTIYGIALGDLSEEEAKIGSAGLIMAIVGGATLPKLQAKLIDLGGSGVSDTLVLGVSETNFSFIIPLLCFTFIAWFGFHVYKKQNC